MLSGKKNRKSYKWLEQCTAVALVLVCVLPEKFYVIINKESNTIINGKTLNFNKEIETQLHANTTFNLK